MERKRFIQYLMVSLLVFVLFIVLFTVYACKLMFKPQRQVIPQTYKEEECKNCTCQCIQGG